MRKCTSGTFAFLLIAVFGLQAASAQMPKIPRIPKPGQAKPQPTPAPSTPPAPGTDANKFYMDRAVVPVQIIGDQDGLWDRAAWKTEAFYGNPLTGFTPPQ